MPNTFSAVLSGLLGGVSSEYKKLNDESRIRKQKENDLLASTLEKRIETDPDLTYEDQIGLTQQSLKARGIPDKVIQGVLNATGLLKRAHDEESAQGPHPSLQVPGQATPNVQAQLPEGLSMNIPRLPSLGFPRCQHGQLGKSLRTG